jgi:hypothetical protein
LGGTLGKKKKKKKTSQSPSKPFAAPSCTGIDFDSGTYRTYNAQFMRKQLVVN